LFQTWAENFGFPPLFFSVDAIVWQSMQSTSEETGDFMELIGKALTMSELVSYQDGSVVSKTLIDKKIGTVTMFSFGSGQGLSEHTAPFDAFVQVVDGEAEVIINGEAQTVSAGQMIIMPANIPHELKAVKPFKMLLVMIRA
jgi:quercetin dioxygenase-like cupin family protein